MIELSHVSFYCLMMTFASLWIHRSTWLWGSFLSLAFILAIYTGVAQPFSALVAVLLFFLFSILKTPIEGAKRHFLTIVAIAVAAGLSFHWIPGFCNWHMDGAFWINFDKPLIGIFPLVFLVSLCQSREDWVKVGLRAVPLTVAVVFGLATLALLTGTISWQIKLPSHFLTRIATNLFLVVIPEEAFFRGFLQRELSQRIGRGFIGVVGGVIGASIVFTLFHLNWNASPALLAFVFLAGILYGTVYELSRFLEGSILCHFAVNLLHMIFFSYHAM